MAAIPLPPAFLATPLAHRGYHDRAARRPENSRAAFRAAVEAGYGIELDVQRSADNHAMVFHDDRLDRLTAANGPVRVRTAAALATTGLRDSDETIPTLAEVLALVAGRVPLLIEIKEQLDTMLPTSGHLESAVAAALAGYHGPVAVMSFNPHCVAHMARAAPGIARGLTTESYNPLKNLPLSATTCARLRAIPDYDPTGSSFISHQAADLGRPRVAALKAQGAAILCWTIRSPDAEAKARRIAQNITFEGYAAAIPA
jgi:glycerophosphoryl diester phosphodiesterase